MKGVKIKVNIKKEIFKALTKTHILMREEELSDYPYVYPIDDLVNVLAEIGGIDDNELDTIANEATDFAWDICHILEVQRKNAE